MRALLWLAAILALASHAHASGGLSCSADDASASFEINAAVTRGMGSPVYQLSGELLVKDGAAPKDLARQGFDQNHLAQYWLDGEDLRLLLYRERDGDKPHGYVELTMRMSAKGEPDEGLYEGGYELAVYDGGEGGGEGKTLSYSGKTSCFVE